MNVQHRGLKAVLRRVESVEDSSDSYDFEVTAICERTGRGGGESGGVGASSLGGILPGIDTQFLHARDESRAVDAHAGCGPIGFPNTAIALGEGAHDLFALLLGILVGGLLATQGS